MRACVCVRVCVCVCACWVLPTARRSAIGQRREGSYHFLAAANQHPAPQCWRKAGLNPFTAKVAVTSLENAQ